MAKALYVSSDDSTYYALTGSSGEFSQNMDSPSDTVYGQSYQSSQPGLLSFSVSGNCYYKGFAGYVAKVLAPGTPTAMTNEACSNVSGLIYQITSTTKRVIDRSASVTVKDNGSAVNVANIEYIDYLFGKVKFITGYTVAGSITITGTYLPMTSIGTAKSFTLTQTANTIETTDFATAQANGGYRTYLPGLKTVTLDLSGFYSASNSFDDYLANRTELVIEVNPDGSGASLCRGFYKPGTRSQSGDVGALEDESMTFNLFVPSSSLLTNVFSWSHTSTTLGSGMQLILSSFLNETRPYVKYLHDGTNGWKGLSVVTDVSLEGSVDGMNIFTANFQGSGAPTVVP